MSPIDYIKYPKNWHSEIRPRILKRAGDRCESCSVPNNALIIRHGERWTQLHDVGPQEIFRDGDRIVRVILTIAHLDHDLSHNTDSNLRAYCQRCHLRHDAEHHAKNAAATRRRQRQDKGQSALPGFGS